VPRWCTISHVKHAKHLALPRRIAGVVGLLALGAFALVQRMGPPHVAQPAGRADRFRLGILTWNVGKIHLAFSQPSADSRASDDDLAHIAHVIGETRPDVVALQELTGRAQLDRLRALLGENYEGHVPETEVNDRRVAILVRRPASPAVVGGASVQARASGDALVFRTVTTSTGRSAEAVSLPVGGDLRALVASVQLDAFSHDQRRTQAEEIVDWANRQPEPELFLCGDFNFDYDFLEGQGAEHSDLTLYRFLTRSFEDLGRGAGGTTILARRTDYIFARTSGVYRRDMQILTGRRINLMDHEPVLGRFEIRRPMLPRAPAIPRRSAIDTRGPGS
jgi:endonuclease/exonuclease/phosphatase family metal-dependent hydrolase